MSMKIVLTAFEPFGGRSVNKSMEVLEEMDGYERFMIPVSWAKAPYRIKEIIDSEKPDLLILTGEAASYDTLKVERIARNIMNGTDNSGITMDNHVIDPLEPISLETEVNLEGIKSVTNCDCGRYLCNYSYFHALKNMKNGMALFIHFPLNKDKYVLSAELKSIIRTLRKTYEN